MRAYPTMKKNNPYTPIMLRGAQGTEPRVFARYGMFFTQLEKRNGVLETGGLIGVEFGKEKQESLAGAYLFLFTPCLFGFFFLPIKSG